MNIEKYYSAINCDLPAGIAASFNVRDPADGVKAAMSVLLARETLRNENPGELKEQHLAIIMEMKKAFVSLGAEGVVASIDWTLTADKCDVMDLSDLLSVLVKDLAAHDTKDTDDIRRRSAVVAAAMNDSFYDEFLKNFESSGDPAADKAQAADDGPALYAGRIAEILRTGSARHADASIIGISRITGGYSKVTLKIEVADAEGNKTSLIGRLDAGKFMSQSSVRDEYQLLKIVHKAGVAVPEPIASGEFDGFDNAIMIVESRPGVILGDSFTSRVRSESLCRDMGRNLAAIHIIPAQELETFPRYIGDSLRGLIAELHDLHEEWRGYGAAHPVIEYAFWWLEKQQAHAISGEGLVHGDYGLHNLLVEDEKITAVLDWEFAKKGFPVEDLALVKLLADSVWSWDCLLDSYVEGGGTRPSQETLLYHYIYQLVRIMVKVESTRDAFMTGRSRGICAASPHLFYSPFLVSKITESLRSLNVL